MAMRNMNPLASGLKSLHAELFLIIELDARIKVGSNKAIDSICAQVIYPLREDDDPRHGKRFKREHILQRRLPKVKQM